MYPVSIYYSEPKWLVTTLKYLMAFYSKVGLASWESLV